MAFSPAATELADSVRSASAPHPLQQPHEDLGLVVRVRQLRERHWSMLWLSLGIIIASFVLVVHDSNSVGPAWMPGISLPLMCGSRALFGVECPGCGLTRSFLALADGDLAAALRFNRVGVLLAIAVVLQIPYRLFALHELRTKMSARTWPTWFGWLLIVALVGNWLLKACGM